ncbi:sugar ABC transporter substrate-binding protein [Pararhizobium polonicum]|uniref:Sugar ABC transporter substrate-binding protein n=1 Tax=Pararhizobium polonicum TaxID=1612624 RepID=A0A1C7NWX9_9HYPH|nr:sugar ABC transporter substrate-binding protein [Pararhizobium polonicum]OBZ93501.1 sugar ABC transporter substrate-binding protein [Pararhizobium polonicum]
MDRRSFLQVGIAATAAAATISALTTPAAAQADSAPADLPSLKGKTIAVSIVGTDHFFDLKAYQAQIAEIERLGGTVIGLDAGRNDKKLVAQLQTLVTQKPDAVIQTLGALPIVDPGLKKLREAGIPVFTVDVVTDNAINNSTSDNFSIGAQLALQLVSDIGGKGNIALFTAIEGVVPCEIRLEQLHAVLKYYPDIKIIQPDLREIVPNTIQDSFQKVTALLSQYPEGQLSAIWASWDIPVLGATQALLAAGRKDVLTYGVDGTPEYVSLVADPNAPAGAVAVQQPELIGKTAVWNVARHFAGQTVPATSFVPGVLANKQNAREIQKQVGQAG